jgi:hypothetical protein
MSLKETGSRQKNRHGNLRKIPDMRTHIILSGLMLFAAFPAFSQTEHRQLGPHVHGHGRLNIAVEEKHVSMELEVPGADIVGFEHEPDTPEQKAALEKAKDKLADALSIFQFPASAGCKLENAKVTIEAEHEHEAADKHHGDDAKKENHEHEEGEHHHSEFHAEYSLSCKSISRLTSMSFDYFNQFAGAQELDVNVITPKGQSSYAVTRANPRLDLAGVM